jgi:hypothetical protein
LFSNLAHIRYWISTEWRISLENHPNTIPAEIVFISSLVNASEEVLTLDMYDYLLAQNTETLTLLLP